MNSKFIRLFRDITPGDGSGPLPPSLADLSDPNYVPPTPAPAPAAPKPGEPGYVEPKFGEPGYVLKEGDEGYVAPGLKFGDEGYVLKFGDEGYVLQPGDEGYVADPNEPPAEDFFAEVDKITGKKYEVEYPEGVDPATPAGVAFREGVIFKQAQLDFENFLKESDPRAYAFMLHRAAGKPEEEFWNGNTGTYTLPDKTALDGSAELQASVYKYDLLARGLDDETAQAIVDKAIKDNKLKEKAVASYTTIDAAQKKQLDDLQKEQDADNQRFNTAVTNVQTRIADAITNEIGFVVPEARKAEFQQYVMGTLQYNEGKFFSVQELSEKELKNQLESMFFQFVKGDLSTVVKKQAKTQAAQGLRLKLDKQNNQQPKGQPAGGTGKLPLPLGDI